MLGLALRENLACALKGQNLVIEGDEFYAQFDRATGALHRLRGRDKPSGMTFGVQAKPGSAGKVAAEFRRLEAKFRDESSDGSLLDYLASEVAHAGASEVTIEHRAALAALRRMLQSWSPPLVTLPGSPRHSWLFPAADFYVPAPQSTFGFGSKQFWNASFGGILLARANWLLPEAGNLRAVARDSLFAYSEPGAEPLLEETLAEAFDSEATGPVSALLMAALVSWHPELKSQYAHQGFQKLTREAFLDDCRLLLSGDGYLSEWLVSLATALSALDGDDLRGLALLWPNPSSRPKVIDLLEQWKSTANADADTTLLSLLELAWDDGLRATLAAALLYVANDPLGEDP
ncbi:MAG: hypothetical protein ACKV0T_07020 [Planctomycetales bacterium]